MVHWQAEVPGSLDEFLARRSRRRRETVRRYSKRLEKTYGDEAASRFRSRDQIDRLFADSASSPRDYQHVLGVGFSDASVQRALTSWPWTGAGFAATSLPEGLPAAFWHGNAYKGVFGIGATGFDPAFADARPGTYLLMRVVEDLAADDSVQTLDFGFGDAEYKRNFGDERRIEQDVVLMEPAHRAGRGEPGPDRRSSGPPASRRAQPSAPAPWASCGGAAGTGWASRRRARARDVRPSLRLALFALGVLGLLALLAVGPSAVLDRPAKVVTMSATVDGPKQEVWEALTDFGAYEEWNPVVTQAEGEAREGAELDLVIASPATTRSRSMPRSSSPGRSARSAGRTGFCFPAFATGSTNSSSSQSTAAAFSLSSSCGSGATRPLRGQGRSPGGARAHGARRSTRRAAG